MRALYLRLEPDPKTQCPLQLLENSVAAAARAAAHFGVEVGLAIRRLGGNTLRAASLGLIGGPPTQEAADRMHKEIDQRHQGGNVAAAVKKLSEELGKKLAGLLPKT